MFARSLLAIALLIPASHLFGQDAKKNILMIAGRPSHGYGSHEHYAGLKILEESIESSTDGIDVNVVKGWPDDASLVDTADSIVIYSDGGGGHPAIKHLDQLAAKLAKGCGFVCIHYAVEMVPGPPGDAMVDMLGGHFEVHWSVNPHWVADFKELPEHPITNGVKPFATNDEWYFHMRFKDSDKVIPILATVAPEHTMRRKTDRIAAIRMFARASLAETSRQLPGHTSVLMEEDPSDSPVVTTIGIGVTMTSDVS